MGRAVIIAICNQKGGCAKTTTAIETGACLALSGAKVLLIDMDHQQNLSEAFGFVDKDTREAIIPGTDIVIPGTYELLMGKSKMDEVVQSTSINNLYLVPASIELSVAETELMGVMGREQQLSHALASSLDKYEYIILDNSPSLGVIVINSLTAADFVLIPVQVFRFAQKGLERIISFYSLIQQRLNPNLKDWMILPTLIDFRRIKDEEKLAKFREQYREKVFKTQIHVNSSIIESQEYGISVQIYDKHSVGAKQYRSFALEMAEWIKAGKSIG